MSNTTSSSPTLKLRDALSSRILDGVSLPIIVVDHESNVRVINKAAIGLFGREEKQVYNKPLVEGFPELKILSNDGTIKSVLAGNGRLEIDNILLASPTGDKRTFSFHVDPLVDSKERVFAATITGLDVTDEHRVRSQLARQNEQLLALHTVSTALRQSFDLRKTLFIVVTALTSVPNALFDHAMIFLAENDQRLRGTIAARVFNPEHVAEIWELLKDDEPFKRLLITQFPEVYDEIRKLSRIIRRVRIPLDTKVSNAVITAANERRTVSDGDLEQLPANILRAIGARHFVATPMLAEGTLLGVLLATSKERDVAHSAEAIKVMEMLADQAAVAITSGIAFQRINDRAQRDSLTGLYNHGYLMSRLHDEVARAKRYSLMFGVLMIDIDHFKLLNDAHGHQVGDEVLLKLSELMLRTARESDICARYGGEEFAIILTNAGVDEAEAFAERLRHAIEAATLAIDADGNKVPVNVSIGVSVFPAHAESEDELIAKADHALYTAKRQGRNRVAVTK